MGPHLRGFDFVGLECSPNCVPLTNFQATMHRPQSVGPPRTNHAFFPCMSLTSELELGEHRKQVLLLLSEKIMLLMGQVHTEKTSWMTTGTNIIS